MQGVPVLRVEGAVLARNDHVRALQLRAGPLHQAEHGDRHKGRHNRRRRGPQRRKHAPGGGDHRNNAGLRRPVPGGEHVLHAQGARRGAEGPAQADGENQANRGKLHQGGAQNRREAHQAREEEGRNERGTGEVPAELRHQHRADTPRKGVCRVRGHQDRNEADPERRAHPDGAGGNIHEPPPLLLRVRRRAEQLVQDEVLPARPQLLLQLSAQQRPVGHTAVGHPEPLPPDNLGAQHGVQHPGRRPRRQARKHRHLQHHAHHEAPEQGDRHQGPEGDLPQPEGGLVHPGGDQNHPQGEDGVPEGESRRGHPRLPAQLQPGELVQRQEASQLFFREQDRFRRGAGGL